MDRDSLRKECIRLMDTDDLKSAWRSLHTYWHDVDTELRRRETEQYRVITVDRPVLGGTVNSIA